ncbi:dockerin type I domain-containing protein [Ruminococcus callidus]|uniref:dockerin type I domain-containing protein n=2 Tax=Ruminococcus callidus TaxID=40519 RepID=UPI0039A2F097
MKTCRRKWFVQWVAAFVSIVLFGTYLGSLSMNTLTVSAICCRKDGFDKSRYTLTGNVAQDVATIAKSQAGRTCSDFGYSGVDYGAWCDEYVADCLENAGCDDSIVAHGGTVADFEKKMRKRGAVVVSSPQPGDLLFFSWSHVEIVTRVEGGTVYCAGGNNQGKTYPGGRCAGERNAQSVAKSMGGSIRLYLRPNYKGVNPNPPKWAKVTLDHYAWMAGETLTFNLSSEGGVAYTVGIDTENADGGRTRIDTHDTRDTSYSRSFNNPGKYSCYITTYNEYGLADSERIYFEVYDKKPENVSVSLDHYGWMLNENMTFTCSSVHGYAYTIGIDDANGNRIDTYDTTGNTYTRSFSTPGKYSCYITTYNGYGYADSERIYFEVYDKKPENVSVSLDHYGWMLNENMTFTCSSVHGYAYTIGIDDANGNRIDTYDTTGNTYTRSFSTPGKYSCYITTYNGYGYADSERIYFEVYDKKPENVSVSLDHYGWMLNENMTFTCSSVHGYAYTIGIDDANGNRIDTYDTTGNTYTRSFSTPGKYSCYITTYNGYGYADSERIYFEVYDGKPTNAKVELDKDSYYVGEELVFRCSSEHGYVYTIGIDSEDGGRTRIDTYDTKESSYTRSFSKPGKYSCYITTYNGYGLADSERIYFTILPSPGDLNFDNTLTTADAVLLQRYLLQERTLTQSQWQTADLNADGTVNGFDLALLRQKLVG